MDRAEGQDAYSRFPGGPLDYVKRDVDRALHQHGFVVTATSTSKEEVAEMDVDALTTPGLYLLTSTGRERMELGMEKPIAPPMWYNQPFDRFGSAAGVGAESDSLRVTMHAPVINVVHHGSGEAGTWAHEQSVWGGSTQCFSIEDEGSTSKRRACESIDLEPKYWVWRVGELEEKGVP
ncbi:hypothetical protein BJV77DRAFT_1133304 [Russula vinacea]|nr:hypothetical protein BJV77DRAFT_1133304 [Russula vinacea]